MANIFSPKMKGGTMMNLTITHVWTDDQRIYAETTDGKVASYAFSDLSFNGMFKNVQ